MKRAVIYCRTSTTEESQLNALENQVQEASACVKTQGWQLVDSYVESGSGTTTHGRDQYKRLYEDLLLDPESFFHCVKLLEQRGMELVSGGEMPEGDAALLDRKTGLYLELHPDRTTKQDVGNGGLERFFERAADRAIPLQCAGITVYTLPHTQHMLYMLLHAFKHFCTVDLGCVSFAIWCSTPTDTGNASIGRKLLAAAPNAARKNLPLHFWPWESSGLGWSRTGQGIRNAPCNITRKPTS